MLNYFPQKIMPQMGYSISFFKTNKPQIGYGFNAHITE